MRVSVLRARLKKGVEPCLGRLVSRLLFAMVHPVTAHACAVCYGDPSSPVSKGLSWAIFALVGVVMGVLGGVIAFFIHASRLATRLEHTEVQTPLATQN